MGPLVIVGYGGSAAGGAGAAVALAAVTTVCRALLRRTERRRTESGPAQLHSEQCTRHRGVCGGAVRGARAEASRAGRGTPGD
nr:hypothetical protein [Streptomyces sp. SID5785]